MQRFERSFLPTRKASDNELYVGIARQAPSLTTAAVAAVAAAAAERHS